METINLAPLSNLEDEDFFLMENLTEKHSGQYIYLDVRPEADVAEAEAEAEVAPEAAEAMGEPSICREN